MFELGYRYRVARFLPDSGSSAGVGLVTGTVLSLTGLVLAFSFSNASGRLDASRQSILDEINAIEGAWRRLDLAEHDARKQLRELFRNYVDARVRAYEGLPNLHEYRRNSAIAEHLLSQAWPVAIEGTSVTANRTLLLNALSNVGDAAAARRLSLATHIPTAVFLFVFGFVLIGSLLIGTMLGDRNNRQWFYRLVSAAVLTSITYVILDMEFPRMGLFDLLHEADAMFVDLRKLTH
jgi:hypothetical protein